MAKFMCALLLVFYLAGCNGIIQSDLAEQPSKLWIVNALVDKPIEMYCNLTSYSENLRNFYWRKGSLGQERNGTSIIEVL